MAIPAAIQDLVTEGFFTRVAAGDTRASSLFARLAAFRLNPEGDRTKPGCLRKGGGHHVDGYSEDAICLDGNPGNLNNVVDLVSGAGQPGARLVWPPPVHRRASDTWEAPRDLSPADKAYLRGSGGVEAPAPCTRPHCPDPDAHKPAPVYPGDRVFDAIGEELLADMRRAGELHLNPQSGTWFARTIWRVVHEGMSIEESIAKSRAEWRAVLGL